MTSPFQSYGQHVGRQPPPPPPPPPPSAATTRLSDAQVPYFATAQQPETRNNIYAMANNAYDYNATRIPGLGLGAASQPLPPTTGNFAFQNFQMQDPSPTSRPLQGQAQLPASSNREKDQPAREPQPVAMAPQPSDDHEDGELSEGEFEDLYEPKDPVDPPNYVSKYHVRPSGDTKRNGLGGAGDADGSSIYGIGPQQGDVVVDSTSTSVPAAEANSSRDDEWEPTYQERDRSGSYSPYLSPVDVQRKASISQANHKKEAHQSSAEINKVGVQPANVLALTNGSANPGVLSGDRSTASDKPSQDSSPQPSLRSLAEAKKKAQEAILGLLPFKVRYQDYIDEGLDTDVVKGLFSDLGLDASLPKPASSVQKSDAPPQVPETETKAIEKVSASQAAKDHQPVARPTTQQGQSKPLTRVDSNSTGSTAAKPKSAAEERKDIIARKLAAKAQKPAVTVKLPTPAQPIPPVQPVAPVQPIAPVQPVASVQAPKLAQPSAPVQASAPIPVSVLVQPVAPVQTPKPAQPSAPVQASAPIQTFKAKVDAQPSTIPLPPKPTTAISNDSSPNNGSSAKSKTRAENNAILHQKLAALKKAREQAELTKDALPASTTLPAVPQVSTASAAKDEKEKPLPASSAKPTDGPKTDQESESRPIHVEAQSISKDGNIPGLLLSSQSSQGPLRNLKRPVASDFDTYPSRNGNLKRTRTQDTLIIDVSDDEDVEMDIGSPQDDFASPMETIEAPPSKLPLAAFPPLSDPHRQQRSSPSSSTAPTPPISETRLAMLHKRIEEERRRLAEAEARRAAKRVHSTQSPLPQPPMENESAKLPKLADVKSQAKKLNAVRRERITSYELPNVDAALKEKQEKLKQLMSQAAQLELEVQAGLSERQKLTSEMEALADSPEGEPAVTDTQSVPDTSNVRQVAEPVPETAQTDKPQESPHQGQQEHLVPIATTAASIEIQDQPKAASPKQDSMEHIPRSPDSGTSKMDIDSDVVLDNVVQPESQAEMRLGPDESASLVTQSESEAVESTNEATSVHPAELNNKPQDGSAQADVSMQTSVAEVSQEENDSFEPTLVQISNPQDDQVLGTEHDEVNDEVLDEPNPNHTSGDPVGSEPDKSSGENEQHLSLGTGDLMSYHSPLGYFRAYRFHPNYFDDVQGGLKSMTYSSRIDPMLPLCPNISSGQECPEGQACDYQHFENMVLPDAEIITQLGSADMFTGETRIKFIEGLKKVLNELKSNRIKDFDRITKAIVKHRQNFLEDKSKVLPLDSGDSQSRP